MPACAQGPGAPRPRYASRNSARFWISRTMRMPSTAEDTRRMLPSAASTPAASHWLTAASSVAARRRRAAIPIPSRRYPTRKASHHERTATRPGWSHGTASRSSRSRTIRYGMTRLANGTNHHPMDAAGDVSGVPAPSGGALSTARLSQARNAKAVGRTSRAPSPYAASRTSPACETSRPLTEPPRKSFSWTTRIPATTAVAAATIAETTRRKIVNCARVPAAR